jgi:hypothetical protein
LKAIPVVTSATVPFGHLSGANEKYVKPEGCHCVAAWGTNVWGNTKNTCIEDVCVFVKRILYVSSIFIIGSGLRPKFIFLVGPDTS